MIVLVAMYVGKTEYAERPGSDQTQGPDKRWLGQVIRVHVESERERKSLQVYDVGIKQVLDGAFYQNKEEVSLDEDP